MKKPFLGIVALEDLPTAQFDQLTVLAKRLNKPLLNSEQGFFNADTPGVALAHNGQWLELRHYGPEKLGAVVTDPNSADIQRRAAGGRRQPFAQALGLHKRTGLRILDATAGLGRDSLVLAMLGCTVAMLERQAVLHALLEDMLTRCPASLTEKLTLLPRQQAVGFLESCSQSFDAVYLDPMYASERRKALPKKEMQLVRFLSGDDEDADRLLAPALECAARVVVKRSPHAPSLGNRKPSYQLGGNRVRYDVYIASKPVSEAP